MKSSPTKYRKTIVISFIVLLMSIAISNAQELGFGINAGLAATDISNVLDPGSAIQTPTSPIFGFHLGIIIDIGFNDHFLISPEILYTNAGAKQSIDQTSNFDNLGIKTSNTVKGTNYINLGYLQMPIFLKYKLDNGLNFSFGPTIDYLLSGNYTGSSMITTTTTIGGLPTTSTAASDTSYKVDTAINKLEIGFAIGMGYQLSNGLGFSLRYVFGISDVFKGGQTYPDTNNPYHRTITQGSYGKNEMFQFSISFIFGTNK